MHVRWVILLGISLCASNGFGGSRGHHRHHGHEYRPGEIIIKLKPNSETGAVRVTAKSTNSFFSKARKTHGLRVKGSWASLNIHHLEIDPTSTKTVEETVASLSQEPDIEYAEPNYILEKMAVPGPVTQSYTLAQVQSFVGLGLGLTSAPIQALNSWAILNSGATSNVVAVIDTGIDFNHSSFSHAIWTNPGEIPGNGIDDDHNGYIDDVHGWNFVKNTNNPSDDEGHGTHVSGIVLGTTQSIFTTPTTDSNIRIMPLKFLDADGTGATSDAIKAIYYAANNGARVMNNSWGGGPYSMALAEAITYAYNKDIVFVVAAGNSGENNDASPSFPANYDMPNIVSVAATDDSDNKANFSNYGPATVLLSSPGVRILSTYPGGVFAHMSGTSMAAPIVAGVAAMMRYQSPSMNSYQIKNLIAGSVDQKSNLSAFVKTSGRVNAYKAVNSVTTASVDSFKPGYTFSVNPANRALTSDIATRGGGCGLVSDITKDFWDGSGGSPQNPFKRGLILLALILLPLMVAKMLKSPEHATGRRKYERFECDSMVTFRIGEKELVGSVTTISLGGSELNTDALLKDGSVITMSISSPDGKTKVDVQGHVVWSEQQKKYGVAFDGVADSIKSQIAQWTQALNKAS